RLLWARGEDSRVERYWSPVVPENPTIDPEEAAEELRRLLLESVRYRLISDVPLGAFLSGGVDSSSVVAAMTREMDRPVRTFSIGFDEAEFDEAKDAAAVAAALGTDHTELTLRPDVEELFENIVHVFDEPFADSSAIPTLLVSKLARQRVTVVLSGDGGDELFGGYTRYRSFLRRNVSIPFPARQLLRSAATRLPQGAYGRNRLLELSRGPWGRYASLVAQPLHMAEGGVAAEELAGAGPTLDELLAEWFGPTNGRDVLTQVMLVDAMSYLPGDILTKLDRTSMAVSLEARVPLLDHRIAEFAFSLPSRFKIRGGRGKWIFHQAVREWLPEEVFRKPKHGFGIPLRIWFRNELRERCRTALLRDSRLFEYVDPRAAARVVEEHEAGRRDHAGLLWRLLVLRTWLDSAAPAASPATPHSIQIPSALGLTAPPQGPG
ncbi:MAG: asparagine synthetase B family protein, partial [Gemmatimonadota bacterium]